MLRIPLMASGWQRSRVASCALMCLAMPNVVVGQAKKKAAPPSAPPAAATLERVRATGALKLGYRIDAQPFSYQESGRPVGYSIDLCQGVAESVEELNLPGSE